MRRRSSAYPLWVGLIATAGLIGLWLSTLTDTAATEAPGADAGVTAAPTPATPRLEWQIRQAAVLEPAALTTCLAAAGLSEASVLGTHPRYLITLSGVSLPVVVGAGEPTHIRTAITGARRAWTRAHVAIAACLRGPQSVLIDPSVSRQWAAPDWPILGRFGGAPVEAFCAVEPIAGGLRTRGLARFDLPDLGIGSTGAAAERMLLQVAAALIGGASADAALATGRGTIRLRPAAELAGWGGPTDLHLLVHSEALHRLAEPAVPESPPTNPTPASKPKPKPKPARPAAPRIKVPKRRARPRPRTPGTRPAKVPVFRPTYR